MMAYRKCSHKVHKGNFGKNSTNNLVSVYYQAAYLYDQNFIIFLSLFLGRKSTTSLQDILIATLIKHKN